MSASQRRLPLPIAPLPDAAPPDAASPFLRPRVRTHVRRPRRGLQRAILAVQLAGTLVVAAAAAWSAYARVMGSERLRVARVDVRGGRFLSEGEVRELLGPAVGENILTLDIDRLKLRLRSSPWVADATVTRTLPDALRVEIRERVPLALAELERLYLMDADGTLIDVYGPRTGGFDLPIVRGLLGLGADSRRDRAQRAGALLADLGELGGFVSEVEVEDSGELRLILRDAGEVVRLGASPPYRKRFTTYLGVRKQLLARCPRAEYFDLRFRDRIYAKEPLESAGLRGDGAPAAVGAAGGAGPGPVDDAARERRDSGR